MTIALCLTCGETKIGAFCDCPHCHAHSTGDVGIDTTFSDHYYTEDTLQSLGSVIKELRRHTDHEADRYWGFFYYVSKYHSDILTVNLNAKAVSELEEILGRCNLPPVDIIKA